MTDAIDLEARLDDEHRAVLAAIPDDGFDPTDLPAMRRAFDATPSPPIPEGVRVEDHEVAGLDGEPPVLVRTYRAGAGTTAGAPALLWIHGGGMILGAISMNDFLCARWAQRHEAVIASIDYRLAPEHPYPAALHDCYAALTWLADEHTDPRIDVARLVVGGASAGGGLAAGLAMMARDRGGPHIAFELLVYPMLDHRNTTRSSHAVRDPRVWHRAANLFAWEAYLGGRKDVPPYASPAIADDLSGLPPTYVCVGDLDLFLDEDVAYATALAAAGVPVELHVYAGAFHGSKGIVPSSPLSRRWRDDEDAALARAFAQQSVSDPEGYTGGATLRSRER